MKHYPQSTFRLHLQLGEVRLKECPLKRLRMAQTTARASLLPFDDTM